jgi:hypothetical protein
LAVSSHATPFVVDADAGGREAQHPFAKDNAAVAERGPQGVEGEDSVLNCPKCGSPRVHRSRTRNVWERLRKNFTPGRIHRCHGCGWRGWGPTTSEPARPEDHQDLVHPTPHLEAIDVTVAEAPNRQGEKAD